MRLVDALRIQARANRLANRRLHAAMAALPESAWLAPRTGLMDRGSHVQRDRAGHVLAHLFMHQTHHRGQAHAMLSGSGVAPPQLDEFLLPSDAPLRGADMAALGWREQDVYPN